MRSVADVSAARAVRVGALVAVASCLGLAESLWMPALPVPGMRLGLANIAVVVALASLGPIDALLVSLGRVLIVGVATGTLLGPVFAMSAAGALAAWMTMALLRSRGEVFSVIGWSVGGAAASVVAQLATASLLLSTSAVLGLAPITLALSLPSGLAIGLMARPLISRLSRQSLVFVG